MRSDVSREHHRGSDAVCYERDPDEVEAQSRRLERERRERVREYRVRLHVWLLRLFENGAFDPAEDMVS